MKGGIEYDEAISAAVFNDIKERLEMGMHFKVIGMQPTNSKRGIWSISLQRVNTGGAKKKVSE